ncbi:MAG: hypothetical protein JO307_23675 [Bryobacterales bacterium]|nr:hypothetical protein [Bryobacterales bacterium]MBV9398603.1 hypothetical protein [Bryobacterales bacterium]
MDKTANAMGAEEILSVNVRQRNGKWNVFSVLMKAGVSNKEWFGEYEHAPGDEFAIERELARSIAEDLRKKLGG